MKKIKLYKDIKDTRPIGKMASYPPTSFNSQTDPTELMNDPLFQFQSKMMYEKFRESEGPYGNTELVFTQGSRMCCEPPTGILWIGCGNGSGLGLIRSGLKTSKVWCIDGNASLLRDIDPFYHPTHAILSSVTSTGACREWHVTSNKDFNGLCEVSEVIEEQYRIVPIRSDKVDTVSLDDLAGALFANCIILDTPGSEVEILKGSLRTLEHVEYLFVKSFLPNSKQSVNALETEKLVQLLGFQHFETFSDTAYTIWTVWRKYLPTTKWSMTIRLNPESSLGVLLYQIATAFSLSKRLGYRLRLPRDAISLEGERQILSRLFKTSPEVYKSYSWHKLVYETKDQYCTLSPPPYQHIMLVGEFVHESFTDPYRKEFIEKLSFDEGLVQQVRHATQGLAGYFQLSANKLCLVCVESDASEDAAYQEFILSAIEEMKEAGAQAFVGLSVSGKPISSALLKSSIQLDLSEAIGFDLLRLLTISEFKYIIVGKDPIFQWARFLAEHKASTNPTTGVVKCISRHAH